MRSLDQLNAKFGIKNRLHIGTGQGGLTRVVITTPAAEAHVYLHGAHVTHYARTGQPPLLFMSKQSAFLPDKPIRGGVPICFPWFGPKNDPACPDAPIHGFARLMAWTVESTSATDDVVTLVLGLHATAQSKKQWPGDFHARYTIVIGATLSLELAITNNGADAVKFEEALHTYFTVADVRNAWIDGLAGASYLDKVDNFATKTQDGAVRITGETDRVYLNTTSACIIHDPVHKRKVVNAKENSSATVVWNPWIAKAKAMSDFGDHEWPEMVCVETVNANVHAVTLAAGQTHTMKAVISSEPM